MTRRYVLHPKLSPKPRGCRHYAKAQGEITIAQLVIPGLEPGIQELVSRRGVLDPFERVWRCSNALQQHLDARIKSGHDKIENRL